MDENKLKEYCLSMANTIYLSLFYSLSKDEILSWGGSDHTALWYKDMASLRMKVNGMLHKGYVVISYDEGMDVFQVFLLDESMNEVRHFEEVYAEELGNIIDENIERRKGTTVEQYHKDALMELVMA